MEGEKAEKNRRKILESIIKHHPIGRSTGELTKDTDLTDETVNTHCKELISQGYLHDKENKFGRYKWTGKILGDPKLRAFLFAGKTIRRILLWNKWICKNNKFCRKDFSKKILFHHEYCKDKLHRKILDDRIKSLSFDLINIDDRNAIKKHFNSVDSQMDQLTLFEFANRIGALITYVLIDAVRPSRKTFGIYGAVGEKERTLNRQDKDDWSIDWVSRALNMHMVLWEFCKLWPVQRGMKPFIDSQDPSYSFYDTADEENFKKLTDAFRNVYPDLFEELEKIRETLPHEIYKYRRYDNEALKETKGEAKSKGV